VVDYKRVFGDQFPGCTSVSSLGRNRRELDRKYLLSVFVFMTVFDIHIHTSRYSDCSFINFEDIFGQAVESHLDGVAITEHGMRWPDVEFGRMQKIASERGIVLINGQEINTVNSGGRSEGDFLVFGLKRSLSETSSAADLIETVHAEGGIIIAAHPYKLSRGGRYYYYGAGDLVYKLKLDALELCHPDHNEMAMEKVRQAMGRMDIPGTGGSDAHKIFDIGSCVTIFQNSILNEEDFIREIRARRISAENRRI
jgi:predicted metal-dependent phosphoesterase TrpH